MAMMHRGMFSWFGVKPKPFKNTGTRVAFAAGEKVFARDGVKPELVAAVRLSLRNKRVLKVKRQVA